MFDELCAALGGRAAEEVVFGEVSTGALNDLEKVTKQAYAMVAYYGLSKKIGNLSYYDSSGQQEFSFGKPFSEKTNRIIDQEISNIVESAYERAKKVLTDHREGLEALAKKLLEKEVIYSDDLVEIFGPRPWGNEPLSVKKHLTEGRGKKKEIHESNPEDNTEMQLDLEIEEKTHAATGEGTEESKKENTGIEPAQPDQNGVTAQE
jgi:cell division protease FtsH